MKTYRKIILASAASLIFTAAAVQPSSANEPTNNNYPWSGGVDTPFYGNMTVFTAFNMWTVYNSLESISYSGDVDYFMMACGSGRVRHVGINFTGANGDLDIAFYTTNGTYLAGSYGVGDEELVDIYGSGYSYNNVVMKVYGYAGSTNPYNVILGCI